MASFDVVSKVQQHELENALQQAQKEIAQRFDFKDTGTSLERGEGGITIVSNAEDRAKAALTVFQEKLIKRKVALTFIDPQKPEKTSKGGARIVIKLKDGIEVEDARKIVAALKESKIKVSSSIQDAQVRITGKNKDDLQAAIRHVRGLELELELQFVNFRD